MSTLFYRPSPFDILVRNFFQDASQFSPLAETKLQHPVDIYQTDKSLNIDIACTGISKEEIEIQIQDNILKINYDKVKDDKLEYIHKGITRKSFNMGWKISAKYDLTNIKAKMKNGLLTVNIPVSEQALPQVVTIK